MSCPACGGENRRGARFCRHCGAELRPSAGTEPSASVEAEEALRAELSLRSEGVGQALSEGPSAASEAVDRAAGGPVDTPLEESVSGTEQGDEAVDQAAVVAASEEIGAAAPEVGEILGGDETVGADFAPETEETVDADEIAGIDIQPEKEESAVVVEPGRDDEESADETSVEPEEMADERVPPLSASEEDLQTEALPEPDEDMFPFWREQAEPLTPASPGELIADRYLVVEALDVQEDEILYHAQDLQSCWHCGFEGNTVEDTFCAHCGASLDRRLEVRLLEVQDAEAEPSTGEDVATRLSFEDRSFVLLAETEPESPERPGTPGIRLVVGQRSDAGLIRELDEDSLLTITLAPTYEARKGPVIGLFAVADGMGGHAGGEVASKLALQELAKHVVRTIILSELAGQFSLEDDIIVRLRQATIAANDAVYLERHKRDSDMGTTLTAVLLRDDRVFLSHVGDCRAYRWNADGLEQLTTDHSVIASMIASGQAKPEEIYTHPHRSVIYRCVGDKATVEVDTDVLPLAPGDRIIVCSDGLWEMIRNEGIEDVMMQEADPQAACDLLVRHANVAGGEDNISVVIVQVEAL